MHWGAPLEFHPACLARPWIWQMVSGPLKRGQTVKSLACFNLVPSLTGARLALVQFKIGVIGPVTKSNAGLGAQLQTGTRVSVP
jgi:hypothetical protein